MASKQLVLRGIAAAPGLALGRVLRFESGRLQIPTSRITEDEVGPQVEILNKARARARRELAELTDEVRGLMAGKPPETRDPAYPPVDSGILGEKPPADNLSHD